jgi:hypothetical protein
VGLLDAIFGHRKPVKSQLDQLFAMSTASTTLTINLRLSASGRAGVCFRPVSSADFAGLQTELDRMLKSAGKEFGTHVSSTLDPYGFQWVLLEDPVFEDLVTTIHMACIVLQEGGFGEQLLAASFRFQSESGDRTIHWVYNYKRGAYYPFVPTGERSRDNALEIRLSALMERELPVEKDMERWFPLWGIPV